MRYARNIIKIILLKMTMMKECKTMRKYQSSRVYFDGSNHVIISSLFTFTFSFNMLSLLYSMFNVSSLRIASYIQHIITITS